MRPVAAFALALVLTAFQAAVLRYAGGGKVSLALAIPIVVYLGLHAGNVEGALGSAGVGYVLDLMAGGPKGLLTFLCVALFLLSRLSGAALAVAGKSGFAVLTAFGTFFVGLGSIVLTRAVTPAETAPGYGLLGRVAVESVLTGLVSPLVLVAMRRIDGLMAREEPGLLR